MILVRIQAVRDT